MLRTILVVVHELDINPPLSLTLQVEFFLVAFILLNIFATLLASIYSSSSA